MANISLTYLDSDFDTRNPTFTNYSSSTEPNPPTSSTGYSYRNGEGDDFDLVGTGFTYNGFFPSGGTVNTVYIDFDNDDPLSTSEVIISNLSTPFLGILNVGNGDADTQNTRFWSGVFAGDDVFDFTLKDYSISVRIAGDGANALNTISSGFTGGDDQFLAGPQGVQASLFGDYYDIRAGVTAFGGDDFFSADGGLISGDFDNVQSGSVGRGGDDTIAPVVLEAPRAFTLLTGDARDVSGEFAGGHDLIDLRLTNISGLTGEVRLYGDAETMNAGADFQGGNDTIYGSSRNEIIYGEAATSFLLTPPSAADFRGGNDSLFGFGGDDTIAGQGGADFLDGGDGVDTAVYHSSDAGVIIRLFSGAAFGGHAHGDTLLNFENIAGSTFNDALLGSNTDNNLISGDFGDDMLDGLGGDDTLIGGGGADALFGDAGNDTASYVDAPGGVVVRLFNGTGFNNFAEGDTLSSIENLIGSDFDDELAGSNTDNNLIEGGAGDDTIDGLGGDDTLVGGAGADDLRGDFGIDTASYADAPGSVVVKLFDGTTGGAAAGDTFSSIENLLGSAFNDELAGDDIVGNVLEGGAGDDTLDGRGGDDTLIGGAGVDDIRGGAGDDTLIGDAGADTLDGGSGVDYVSYADVPFSTRGIIVRLFNGTAFNGVADGDILVNIENVMGSNGHDNLIGSNGANVLEGRFGDDTLRGLLGNDTLSGGVGRDTFEFSIGEIDHDRITDFHADPGPTDVISVIGFGTAFDEFSDITAAATNVGSDVVIDFGGGNTLLLENLQIADLFADDFLFG